MQEFDTANERRMLRRREDGRGRGAEGPRPW